MPTWSQPISLKGATGSNATLPTDFTPNSVAIAPVSGDTTPSQLTQKNGSGALVFASDPSGNVTIGGTLAVAGASTLGAVAGTSASWSGNETVGGNLNVTGTATVGALTASATNIAGNQVISGNDTVNGDLKVLGNTTLAGLTATGASNLAALNATTSSIAGNESVGGTLNVSGAATLAALTCTTLRATGAATFVAAASVGADFTVTGTCQLKGVNCTTLSATGNATIGGTLTVTGTVNPLGNLNVNGNGLVQGDFTCNGKIQAVGALVGQASAAITNNLSVGGVTTMAATNASSLTVTGNINVAGSSTLGSTLPSSLAVTNSATVGTTLKVTGATTLASTTTGALTASSVTNTGNETVGGTLQVNGGTTLAGLSTTGVTNSGNGSVGGTLAVTGATTAAAITSSGTVQAKNLTLTSGGGGALTFADGTSMTTAATGSTGGGAGGTTVIGSSPLPFGQFWSTAYTANAVSNIQTITQTQTNTLSASTSTYAFPASGNLVAVSARVDGNVTGSTTVNVLKNNAGLGASITVGSGTGTFTTNVTPSSYAFAANDVLSLTTANTTGGNFQVIITLTVAINATTAGAIVPSRSVIEGNTYWNQNNPANTLSATNRAIQSQSGVNGTQNFGWRVPFGCAVVSVSMKVDGTVTGSNLINFYKNGAAGTQFTVSTATGTFRRTFTLTDATFAADDLMTIMVGNTTAGNFQCNVIVTVQWTA